jgi:hypothetical protein
MPIETSSTLANNIYLLSWASCPHRSDACSWDRSSRSLRFQYRVSMSDSSRAQEVIKAGDINGTSQVQRRILPFFLGAPENPRLNISGRDLPTCEENRKPGRRGQRGEKGSSLWGISVLTRGPKIWRTRGDWGYLSQIFDRDACATMLLVVVHKHTHCATNVILSFRSSARRSCYLHNLRKLAKYVGGRRPSRQERRVPSGDCARGFTPILCQS